MGAGPLRREGRARLDPGKEQTITTITDLRVREATERLAARVAEFAAEVRPLMQAADVYDVSISGYLLRLQGHGEVPAPTHSRHADGLWTEAEVGATDVLEIRHRSWVPGEIVPAEVGL